MDLDVIIEIDSRARHSASSQSSAGKALRAARSIFSNSSRRLAQTEMAHWTLVHASHNQRNGPLHSASDWRNRPKMYVWANLTPASTFALSIRCAGSIPTE